MRTIDLFLDLEPDQDWQRRAGCQTEDPAAFVASVEQGDDTATLAVCWSRCPVREACAAYADANDERFGIWGGVRRG